MASFDDTVYKLEGFQVWSDGTAESRFNSKPWKIEDMIEKLKFKVIDMNRNDFEIEFDLVGIGPPIANALRRILIAETPTMAIDRIHLYNNTTVIPDEVLTHRIGLIPINVDPRLFEYKATDDEEGSEEDTLQFELKVKCTRKMAAPKNVPMPDNKAYNHSKVYSEDLKFIPIGKQKDMYGDIRPVHEDILISVMNPGHEIDLKAFCFKNIGREHAKFSPVVIATYRLHPELKLKSEICGESAHTLAKCFPEGVIKVSKKKNREIAKVVNPRKITCSRNVFLHDDLKDEVEICKKKDHYIFTVESVGALQPEVLVVEAIKVLKEKCRFFLEELKSLS